MSLKWILANAMLVIASCSLADAATVYFTTLPTITGGCYFCYRDPVVYFGAYEGYVSGTIDGIAFSNWVSDELVWDGSYQPNIGMPSGPIEYTLTSFAGPGTDLSSTWPDFAYPSTQPYNTVLAKYEEAALLLGGDGTPGLPGFVNIDKSNAALVRAYQFALYSIFTSTSTIAYWGFDPTVGGAATALLTQVQNDIANPLPSYAVTYSQLRIYTPASEGLCHQGLLYWCSYNAEFLQFVGLPQANAALQFIPLTPCRVMDTRNPNGPLGGPFLSAETTRTVPVSSSSCGVPANAAAYSVNLTVVPRTGFLGYLSVWPTGQTQPVVSTLNSFDGSILANAAIVPAGASGSINAFASNDTDLVMDIDGYFITPGVGSLQFYPLAPCRVLDTRNPYGTFGGPALTGGASRSFPIPSSSVRSARYCGSLFVECDGGAAREPGLPDGMAHRGIATGRLHLELFRRYDPRQCGHCAGRDRGSGEFLCHQYYRPGRGY